MSTIPMPDDSRNDPQRQSGTCPMCGRKNRLTYSRLAVPFRCAQCKQPLTPPASPIDVARASDFDRLIESCLNKDPALRPASAGAVSQTLRRIREQAQRGVELEPARDVIRSLAVLPLDNVSRDPAQEYFADGMTEALISELARLKALRVISRTSAMKYKGAQKALLPRLQDA